MKRTICWWLGHSADEWMEHGGYYHDETTECCRCGDLVGYYDISPLSRHERTKIWLVYWLFRRWMPEKCRYCGKRNSCDCPPF